LGNAPLDEECTPIDRESEDTYPDLQSEVTDCSAG
jgi:hypothetical protein